MKGVLFLFLILLISCADKTNQDPSAGKTDVGSKVSSNINNADTINLQPWFQYYQKQNPEFSRDQFKLDHTSPINYEETTVIVMNEKGFNEVYEPFFVFNKSGDHYLDFDSYQWSLLPDGSPGFEADQQVVLVDYINKTAKQIAFFGPSYWIEDAYWKGDSVAVLFGNTYEKVPFIMEYNFDKNTMKNFVYQDTLKFDIPYSKIRMQGRGIIVN